MADIDFSLLDVPRSVPVEDPEAYLRAAIAWHFGEDTGTPFWLRIAQTLNFNPLTEVNTFADLRLFPNLVNELRSVAVEDLIPRGYGNAPPLPQIFESGGTTGAPKRTVQMPDWIAQVVQWQTEDFATGGFVQGLGFLCLMPSGPHGVGYFSRLVAERLGAVFHAIDIDPRWVKKIAARNAAAEVAAYIDHVIEQAVFVLQTQNVANLHTTPPLLEAIARNDHVVDLVNDKIRYLLLSGAHVDADTLDLLREHLPGDDDHHGLRQHDGFIPSRHSNRRRRLFRLRPAHAIRGVPGGRSSHRGTSAVRTAGPSGDEPHQQGNVHTEQPGARSGNPDARAGRATQRLGQ